MSTRKFIDVHTHTFFRSFEDLEEMALAGIEGIVICSFFPEKPSAASTLLDTFKWVLNSEKERVENAGIKAYPALGIHPKSIPASGIEDVLKELTSLIKKDVVYALGEIGLEDLTNEEEEVLRKQLRIAKEHDLPVIMHTPRKNKDLAVKKILHILVDEHVNCSKVLVDHLTLELISQVRELGAYCGLTVQPGKLSFEHVKKAVESFGVDRMVVDSDVGRVPSDHLAVPKTAYYLIKASLNPHDVELITYFNAKKLLKG
ncbi:MAG: hypothetical protein DRJ31_02355 [Candidatus Methanomethylicota archaeon]|uniref:Uncharacterized protein n=1 Tax=Thermoproteota archaeon TaxID=2056631 RepID=A0A497F1I9_9CREN|nr:MAG: hypothetical protein DRJ31_02355 [Candidatus Verstraetearchaeota archaeon]RLE52788.1 MAG: hypothetical protein DRJ33_02770 [Candidatus Verstraetearchaeota archaeon]